MYSQPEPPPEDMDNPTNPIKLPQDLSPRVADLARVIDRLPPGTHLIQIVKPEIRAKEWIVEVSTVQRNRSMRLPKKSNGGQDGQP